MILRKMIWRKKKRPGRKRHPFLVIRRAAARQLNKVSAPYRRKVIIWDSFNEKRPQETAQRLKCSVATVYRWLARYRAAGPAGLASPPQGPSVRRLPDAKHRRVRALLQAGSMSTRRIAMLVGVSQSVVARAAKARKAGRARPIPPPRRR